jgi:putative N6-adenine-specific DNA methylase
MDLFVTCMPGLELLLADELAKLGYAQTINGYGGVHVKDNSLQAIFRINYLSRLASRVLLPLAKFRCDDAKSLYNGIRRVDWSPYLSAKTTIAIDANVFHPELRNSLFASQVAKDAICDQLVQKHGWRPSVNIKEPDVQLNLFINQGVAVMSIDTSGQPLHKRGYRQESIEAPMQETLAAALLAFARFEGKETVCDPCCGSGTLLIEAALFTSKTAPGFLRQKWGFFHLPDYSQEKWFQFKVEVDHARIPLPKHQIFGADLNKQAVHACKVNLRIAGFHHSIEVAQCDIREYEPPKPPNFVIVNPPYGKRLNDEDSLKPLYRALGDFMKRKTEKPAKGYVFTGSFELSKEVGLAATRRHVIDNGGIESRLLEFDLYTS